MALMHPRELDESHAKSRAEIAVFRAIEQGLSDEWRVYHDVSFIRRDHDGCTVVVADMHA